MQAERSDGGVRRPLVDVESIQSAVDAATALALNVAPSKTTIVGFGSNFEVDLSTCMSTDGWTDTVTAAASPELHLSVHCFPLAMPVGGEEISLVVHDPSDVVFINRRCLWRRDVAVRVRDGDVIRLYVPSRYRAYRFTVRRVDALHSCQATSLSSLPPPTITPTVRTAVTTTARTITPDHRSNSDFTDSCDRSSEGCAGVGEGTCATAFPAAMVRHTVMDSEANRPFVPVRWWPPGTGTNSSFSSTSPATGSEEDDASLVHANASTPFSSSSRSPCSSEASSLACDADACGSTYRCAEMSQSLRSQSTVVRSPSECYRALGDPVFYCGSFSRLGDALDAEFARGRLRGRRTAAGAVTGTDGPLYTLNPRAVTVHSETTYIATPVVDVTEPTPDDPMLSSLRRVSFSFPAVLTPRGFTMCADTTTAGQAPGTLEQCARAVMDMLMFAYQTRTNCFHYFSEPDKQRLRRCSRRVVEHLAEVGPAEFRPVIHLRGTLFCCSDVLGNFADVQKAYEQVCYLRHFSTQHTPILFLGNYVGRGDYSVEVVLLLLAWRLLRPQDVHLLRGSAEDAEVNGDMLYLKSACFTTQCRDFYYDPAKGDEMWTTMNAVLATLPVAAVIDEAIFACHGGVPMLSACPRAEFPAPSEDRIAAAPHNDSVHRTRMRTEQDNLLPPVRPAADGTICADYFYVAVPTEQMFEALLSTRSAEPGSAEARAFLFDSLGMRDGEEAELAARRRLVRELLWNDLITHFDELQKPVFTRPSHEGKWRLMEKFDGSAAGPAELRLSLIKYSALRPTGDSLKLFLNRLDPVAAGLNVLKEPTAPSPAVPLATAAVDVTPNALRCGEASEEVTDEPVRVPYASPPSSSSSSAAEREDDGLPFPLSPLSDVCSLPILTATETQPPTETAKSSRHPVIRISARLNGLWRDFPRAVWEAQPSAAAVDPTPVRPPSLSATVTASPAPAHVNAPFSVVCFPALPVGGDGRDSDEEEDDAYVEFPWMHRDDLEDSRTTMSSQCSRVSGAMPPLRPHHSPLSKARFRMDVRDPLEYTIVHDADPRITWRLARALHKARRAAGLCGGRGSCGRVHVSAGTTVNARGFCSNHVRADHQGVIRQFTAAAATHFLDRFRFSVLLRGHTVNPAGVLVSGGRRIISVFTYSYYSKVEVSAAGACLFKAQQIQLLAWRTRYRPRRACVYKDSTGCYMHERSLSIDSELLTEAAKRRRRRDAAHIGYDANANRVNQASPIEVILDPLEGFSIVVNPENRRIGSAPDPSRPIDFICLIRGDDPRRERYREIWREEDARHALVSDEATERAALLRAVRQLPLSPQRWSVRVHAGIFTAAHRLPDPSEGTSPVDAAPAFQTSVRGERTSPTPGESISSRSASELSVL